MHFVHLHKSYIRVTLKNKLGWLQSIIMCVSFPFLH